MYELRLLAPEHRVEALGDALEALDAASVSVEDADAQTDDEHALFGEPGMAPPRPGWHRSRIAALFAGEHLAQHAASSLRHNNVFADCAVVAIAEVPEQDWVRLTQAQFEPVPITPDFWVVPTWHTPPASARRVIRLDPGLAFGTGTHPTTRMCLRWIAGAPLVGAHVLDYGCGSGILAIGAAMFGAANVDAVDIDPAAIDATHRNARANGVALRRCALPHGESGGSGMTSGAVADRGTETIAYQVVLANILATPLKVLAPLLCAQLAADGTLVLAGILERQAEALRDAYAPYLRLEVSDDEEGWILMTGRRS